MRQIKDPIIRRDELLNTAERLIYQKGYELMTVQDILTELSIAKGTFYHYFASKETLLEAIITRMLDDAETLLQPIVTTPNLPALEKLQRFFTTLTRWKAAEHKALLLAVLRVWYANENALTRHLSNTATTERLAPLLSSIVKEGIAQGSFTMPYSDEMGELIIALIHTLQHTLAKRLLSFDPVQDAFDPIVAVVESYNQALERILGAPLHSLELIEPTTLRAWFLNPDDS
jgi:AcrR family transcriptional regulator